MLVGAVWEVVEHSKSLDSLSELTADIPGILIPTTILTFPQRHVEPLSACLCEPVSESQLPEIVDEFEKKDNTHEMFQREPEIPVELQGAPSMNFSGGHEEQPESLWINGKEVSKQSKVRDLQDACNFLGVNASGSKTKLFDRLCSYFKREHRKDMESIKHNLQQQTLGPQAKIQTKGAEKPDDPKIIERHEVTHLPFVPWCDSCLKTKSREDKTIQNTDAAEEDSGVPHIQMDWMYLGRNCPALILLDTTTRYGAIFPARSKGVWRALAEFCARFSLGLNYLSEVVYVMDSEPATLGLLDMVVMVRQEMGYPTSKKVGKPYHKGRTARVERYIQTVRRHASTLMTSVEDHIHEVLHDLHCLRAWSLVHAVFLLNRFHEHSAIKATAFETVFGRQYNGKLLPFGGFAFGLRKPMKKTGTSVWQGGIWIGKDESDMHVLITPGGQFHTRSIRRCSNPWRADVITAITMTPWTKAKGSGPVGLLEAPLPVIEERAEGEDPREPILLKTGDIDEEAEAVRDQASYTPTEVGSPQAEPSALVEEPLERLTEVQRKSLLGIPIIPGTPPRSIDIEVDQEGVPAEKREGAELEEGREIKAARHDRVESPQGSPKQGLYAPLFAGSVESIDNPHGDICWEQDIDWEMVDEELEHMDIDFHCERPPDVTPEELQQIDGEAMKAEVEKLTSLGVVKTIDETEMAVEGKFIDLKEVFDWRFRDGQWKRRCRIVAREFKTGPSTEETFSPTSSHSVVKFFLFCHLFFGWKIASIDVSDAYLTVKQQEICYVKISSWIKNLLRLPESSMWQLCKVLPGQRNGAQRWFQDFTAVLKSLGFSQCVAMPSLLRHRTRRVVLNVRVDDELIAAEQASDIEWLVQELRKIYKLQIEGPVPLGPLGAGEELNYLKKVYVFAEEGVYVKANQKHVESLLRLYELEGRKAKQVPEHCLLGHPDTSPELDSKRQAVFRSGLGMLCTCRMIVVIFSIV